MSESAGEGEKQVDPVAKGCGIGCLGVLAVFLAFFVYAMFTGEEDDGSISTWEAEQHCEDFAEKRLKAPGSAEFDLTATGGPTYYTVTGTVDSENSFGAMLRSDLTCELRVEGEQVYLESLTGLDG